MEHFLNTFQKLLERLPVTVTLIVVSFIIGIILGLVIAMIRIHRVPVLTQLATVYVSFFRGTPILVQLFLVFYGIPMLLNLIGINVNGWDKIIFAIITLSFNSAAFLSEVIRSAYLAVGQAQLEAAYSVGMNYFQAVTRIIFPQAFRMAIPNLGNNVIVLVKESSLAFSIGVTDLMGKAIIMRENNYGINMFEIYLAIAIIYWILCVIIEQTVLYLEKKTNKGYTSIGQ